MHMRGYSRMQIARSLSLSWKTVNLWIERDAAGDGTATKEHQWPLAPQIDTTEAGYAVVGLSGWFGIADVRAATGASDTTALLKKMCEAGAIERKRRGRFMEFRSLVAPREWLAMRGVWWLALLGDASIERGKGNDQVL